APVVLRPKFQTLSTHGGGGGQDGALQTTVGPLVGTTNGLNLLGVGNGFPSYTVPDAPSDVNLAVGDTQVVQWVNVSYAIFDKSSGAILAGPVLGNAFWSGFGGTCQSSNSGDMIAQWDKIAHRWVMTQPVFSNPYMTCIAISTTPDATGTYYRFAFPQSAGFPDYPKWGLMPDAYYQSQNIFQGNAFAGVNVCAYQRAKLLVGDSTAKQVCILDNSNGTLFDDSLLPADLDSAGTLPPAGQPEVFMGSIDNVIPESRVFMYLFHADFTTPANSTFTGVNGSMPISVSQFNAACNFGACIPQPNTTWQLDSLADRLMYRLAYRNFANDHQTWLVSHSVAAGGTVGERWYEFHAPEGSTAISVFQQGTFAPADSNYRWMGSIAMDQSQDIALGYSESSSSVFPSIYYTGRVPSDPAGTMESESLIIAGTGSQLGTSNRWGDYTSMALDAADDCTFWYTNQYYSVTAQFDWSTRLASFKFPSCGGTATAPPSAPALQTPTVLNTYQVRLNWTEAAGQSQTGFNIFRCTGSICTPSTLVASVGNVTTYTDGSASTPLAETTTYTYAVVAVNSAGPSSPSNSGSATTQTEAAPSSLAATASQTRHGKNVKDSVRLSWVNNSADADGNYIERCQGSGCSNFSQLTIAGATATTYTESNVATKTSYTYRVRAHSPGGFSVYSNVVSLTTP
ncbi:MAG TPA: fibronectin type III domain-containing protein, partial [Terriglobia bacterium]|nr:fibronectin type III domain-containing protein [Terriglobia bacterium]